MTQGKSKKAKGKNEPNDRRGFAFLLLPFYFRFAFAFLLLPFAFHLPCLGQEDDLAPPPLRTVTKDERRMLEPLADVKARTKLALEYMNAHLTAAEQLNSTRDFDGMFRELGGFQGLLDHTLAFLTSG